MKPRIGLREDVPKAKDDCERENEIEAGKGFFRMDGIFEKHEAQTEQREDRELRLRRELGMVDFYQNEQPEQNGEEAKEEGVEARHGEWANRRSGVQLR